ncbi:hypothetical protein ND747_12785, partial [Frankia sp. R82]|nr:hypothetical protein [Frankia sp. R82]
MPSPGSGDDEAPRSAEQPPPQSFTGDGPGPDTDFDDTERTILQPTGHRPSTPGPQFGSPHEPPRPPRQPGPQAPGPPPWL